MCISRCTCIRMLYIYVYIHEKKCYEDLHLRDAIVPVLPITSTKNILIPVMFIGTKSFNTK